MKSKATTYILLFCVILIWSIIFIRILNHINDKEESNYIPYHFQTDTSKIAEVDTNIVLAINYTDPFLKRNYIHTTQKKKVVSNTGSNRYQIHNRINEFNRKEVQPVIEWPEIAYNGIILNKEQNKQLVAIQINNESFLTEKNDVVANIKILNVFADSIILEYQKQKKTFLKP